jgi:hypothetical protein
MSPACSILLLVLAGAPPFAAPPAGAPQQAAAPTDLDRLGALDSRRLRFALGVSYSHLVLDAPGGNSMGLGVSAALEGRYLELALSLYGQGGFGAQNAHARHTGPSTSYLRLTGRVAPFPAFLRVLFELGGQVGWDRAFAWCSATSQGDQCGVVPDRVSFAGVAGLVTQLRLSRFNLTLGLDVLVRGPKPPDVCSASGCVGSPLGQSLFGLQAWLEAGFGGVAW